MKLFRPYAVLLLLLCFQQAHSQNVVAGAEISYKCTTQPGIFELTLIIYRTCDQSALCIGSCGTPCNQTVRVMGADAAFASTQFDSISVSLISVRDVNMNPDCPSSKNTCTNMGCVTAGTYAPGYERYEFKGFVNVGPTSGIPVACCNVRFAWNNGVRDNRLNTITSSQAFYIDATMNRCLSTSPCNNSPVIENDAIAAVCGGENVVFNNGLVDPDFDSLSFAFAPALIAYNSAVTYLTPYAFNKPMPWSGTPESEFPGGIRCDPNTGDILFTPGLLAQNFTGVMVIEVKQWKIVNGVPTVIGITRRDFTMTVLANCPPNNPPRLVTKPSLESNPNAPKTNWEICSGQQLCFSISAMDTDFIPPLVSDTTFLTWNRAIASLGATFLPVYNPVQRKLNGPREDEYQFCWTPQDNAAKSSPYYFTVKAKDTRCPNPGTITRAFAIKVNKGYALSDTVNIIKSDSGCGRHYFTAVHTGPNGNIFQRFMDVSLFPNDPAFTKGSVTYPYHQYVSHIFNQPGTYNIRYRAYDTVHAQNGCSPYFTVSSTVYSPYTNPTEETIVSKSPTCSYSSDGEIRVTVTYGFPPFMYSFNNGPFSTDTVYKNLTGGMYTLRIKDSTGCAKEIRNIEVKNAPRFFWNGMLNANKNIFYTGDTVTYNVILNDTSSAVGWKVTNGIVILGPGKNQVKVIWNKGPCSIEAIGNNNGCFDTITQNMTVTNVGMPELQASLGISVFPNPTKNTLTISLQNLPQNKLIYLYDFQGKLVLQQELKLTQHLNLQELPQGVYMLRVGDWHGKVVRE